MWEFISFQYFERDKEKEREIDLEFKPWSCNLKANNIKGFATK